MRFAGLLIPVVLAASASAGAVGSPVSLIASPARLALGAPGSGTVEVTNTGRDPVVVDVARAGFALDLRGHPQLVPRAGRWVVVRPARHRAYPGKFAAHHQRVAHRHARPRQDTHSGSR